MKADSRYVDIINDDTSFSWLNNTEDGLDEGRFAAPCSSNNPDFLPPRKRARDVFQDRRQMLCVPYLIKNRTETKIIRDSC